MSKDQVDVPSPQIIETLTVDDQIHVNSDPSVEKMVKKRGYDRHKGAKQPLSVAPPAVANIGQLQFSRCRWTGIIEPTSPVQ
ncbi:hypothetical protein SAY86_019048 [Trapa natans]|uniref:Uncharacterized protein n=1 Tax=Trapa natans TaxID=22666 RepID=A0AAN7LG28_TRANT|nr:hypothetical protein SAY86_019048 [Trapa natans]